MNSFQIHNYDENSINYKYASREEIIKWIYELNSDDKIIAFSITNVKLCEFIQKCHTLLKVDISNTKITTDGIQQIVEGVTDNDSIKEINAENNPMLDKVKAVEMFKFKDKFKINV